MRTLHDTNINTEAPLELIIWTNEEGTRFVPVMMGSGAYCKVFPVETALNAVDLDGKSVRDELKNIGYDGDYPVPGHALGAYLEAHIEQGPILEAQENVIGVVTGSLGLRWYDVTVTGMEAHAGPTPMELRQDALYAASFLMQAVIEIAREFGPEGRGTVGVVDVYPSSRNVIPGSVKFSVDLRHEKADLLDEMEARFRSLCEEISTGKNIGFTTQIDINDIQQFAPTPSLRNWSKMCGVRHKSAVIPINPSSLALDTMQYTLRAYTRQP